MGSLPVKDTTKWQKKCYKLKHDLSTVRTERRAQKKELKRLRASNARNRAKLKSVKAEYKALQRKVSDKYNFEQEKPKGHTYSSAIILLVLRLRLMVNCSFRSSARVLGIIGLSAQLYINEPSHATVILWMKKLGYYYLTKPVEEADDWVVFIDENVPMGRQKLMVVLGVRQSSYDFQHPLTHQDMVVLLIKSKESWKGEDIALELEQLKEKLGNILYVVCDKGNNLCRALRLAGLLHMEDVSHAFARILHNHYKHNKEMQVFLRLIHQFRNQNLLGKHDSLIPPAQRAKARFMNLHQVCAWAEKGLACYEHLHVEDERYQKLNWLSKFSGLIRKLQATHKLIQRIFALLKTEGLSKYTVRRVLNWFYQAKEALPEFIREAKIYLEKQLEISKKYNIRCICTSDVIESVFGKYKNYVSPNASVGVSDLALCIAAFTANPTQKEITEAMTQIKVKDLEQWKLHNMTETLLSRRKKALKIGT